MQPKPTRQGGRGGVRVRVRGGLGRILCTCNPVGFKETTSCPSDPPPPLLPLMKLKLRVGLMATMWNIENQFLVKRAKPTHYLHSYNSPLSFSNSIVSEPDENFVLFFNIILHQDHDHTQYLGGLKSTSSQDSKDITLGSSHHSRSYLVFKCILVHPLYQVPTIFYSFYSE